MSWAVRSCCRASLRRRRSRRSHSHGEGADPEPVGRPPHQRRVAGRVGRCKQEQLLGLLRKGADPPPEALFDAARERDRTREPEPAGQLGQSQSPRQLQQRQRVAPCLGDDLVPNPLVNRPSEHRLQQRTRIGILQARDRVNAISPGVIDTGAWDALGEPGKADYFAIVSARNPTRRIGTADDIANGVLFAMTSGFLTGQTLHIDGGEPLT
jgi:hypothetical protein